jgi:Mlc titration factor MtfA (ptsG expression regulator)
VAQYRFLSEAEQQKLRDDLRVFIADRYWEGCNGLVLTDEMKVTVAAQACLLILGLEPALYNRLKTILIYPRGYAGPEQRPLGGPAILESQSARLGEAHYRGPVILSWEDVLEEGRSPRWGKNLVFHEFAHQLDMLDGAANGTPPLASAEEARRWKNVMTSEFRQLVEASERGKATLLDQYGAENEAEFFAVATECFFDRPVQLSRRHPQLYALLRDYYRQDPAKRVNATS